ncbi:MAG TPA: oxidoreductase [Acidimicrobiales bacterium]|nr:oxidoreductase [Acidimicrobiales bacterium]
MAPPEAWVRTAIPRLDGTVAVVTGANSGIGLHTARLLAGAGATVVLGCRDHWRAEAARAEVAAVATGEAPEVAQLDCSELASVRDFAAAVRSAHPAVDVLVNNAGVMAVPLEYTVDGFERQLAVNHLAPFALTAELLPALERAPAARVVAVSSLFARRGAVILDDLMGERWYEPWAAYAQSKLADLLFAAELARRLARAGSPVASLAAHPGYAATRLVANGPARWSGPVNRAVYAAGALVVAQSAAAGALPSVAAAAHPDARTGQCWGPGLPGQVRGRPKPVAMPRAARDEAVAAGLWQRSVELTGARWPF